MTIILLHAILQHVMTVISVHKHKNYAQFSYLNSVIVPLCLTAEPVSQIIRTIKYRIRICIVAKVFYFPSIVSQEPILRMLSSIRFYRDNAMFTVVKQFSHIDLHCIAFGINIGQYLSQSVWIDQNTNCVMLLWYNVWKIINMNANINCRAIMTK
jgi:hypothetical protein